MQEFTGNVKGQIRRIDEAFDKAQVIRQKILAFIHDEDVAAVELQACFIVRIIQIEWSPARNEKECRIFDGPFGFGMEDFHRVFPFKELVLEKFLVFFRFDVRLIACPQGLHGVESPRFYVFFFRRIFYDLAIGILGFFFYRVIHGDRIADVVGILFDQAGNLVAVRVVFFLVAAIKVTAQMQDDGRTVFRFFTFVQRVLAIACRFPLVGLAFTSLTGNDRNGVGDHKSRIKTNTKLANHILISDFAICFLGFFQLFQEGLGTGFGNRTEILNQVVTVHAQTIIGNSQSMGVCIRCDMDFKTRIAFEQIAVRQRFIVQFIDRIRGIGNQFPQENFMIRINGMDHQVQQLFRFRLEFKSFFRHDL